MGMSRASGEVSSDPAAGGLNAANGGGAASRDELLNRSDVVPLYYQLEEILESRILSGVWPSGHPLPSERELCEEFGVSRAVVRPALDILERQGRIVRHQGKGTQVAPPKHAMAVEGIVARFAREIDSDTEIHVLDAAERRADADATAALGINAWEQVHHVSAKVTSHGRPRCLCNSTIALEAVPWLRSVVRTNARLSGCGPFGEAPNGPVGITVENGVCPDFEADQLELAPGSQVFVAHLTQFDVRARKRKSDRLIERSWLIYPADSVRLDVGRNQP